jgi:hypothetical protein
VENLLDRALEDVTDFRQATPVSRCAAALTEAASELRILEQAHHDLWLGQPALERAALERRLKALLPRLRSLERLLASAGKFYHGWCAVGQAATPPPGYSATGYEVLGWSSEPGPALLALKG